MNVKLMLDVTHPLNEYRLRLEYHPPPEHEHKELNALMHVTGM